MRGVTLVELMVALAVLALVLGMTGVGLASLRPPAGAEAHRAFERARADAIRSGTPVRVEPESGAVVLFLPDGRAVGGGVDPLTGAAHDST